MAFLLGEWDFLWQACSLSPGMTLSTVSHTEKALIRQQHHALGLAGPQELSQAMSILCDFSGPKSFVIAKV